MKHPHQANKNISTREPSRSSISAPSSRNSASMSGQRTFAETGRAKISSRVRWCLRFMIYGSIKWYQSDALKLAYPGWNEMKSGKQAKVIWMAVSLIEQLIEQLKRPASSPSNPPPGGVFTPAAPGAQ